MGECVIDVITIEWHRNRMVHEHCNVCKYAEFAFIRDAINQNPLNCFQVLSLFNCVIDGAIIFRCCLCSTTTRWVTVQSTAVRRALWLRTLVWSICTGTRVTWGLSALAQTTQLSWRPVPSLLKSGTGNTLVYVDLFLSYYIYQIDSFKLVLLLMLHVNGH